MPTTKSGLAEDGFEQTNKLSYIAGKVSPVPFDNVSPLPFGNVSPLPFGNVTPDNELGQDFTDLVGEGFAKEPPESPDSTNLQTLAANPRPDRYNKAPPRGTGAVSTPTLSQLLYHPSPNPSQSPSSHQWPICVRLQHWLHRRRYADALCATCRLDAPSLPLVPPTDRPQPASSVRTPPQSEVPVPMAGNSYRT